MCNGATLDVDYVSRKPEFLHDRERYDREGFVDFNTLDVGIAPACARQRLFDCRDRTEAKRSWETSAEKMCRKNRAEER